MWFVVTKQEEQEEQEQCAPDTTQDQSENPQEQQQKDQTSEEKKEGKSSSRFQHITQAQLVPEQSSTMQALEELFGIQKGEEEEQKEQPPTTYTAVYTCPRCRSTVKVQGNRQDEWVQCTSCQITFDTTHLTCRFE